VGPVIGVKS